MQLEVQKWDKATPWDAASVLVTADGNTNFWQDSNAEQAAPASTSPLRRRAALETDPFAVAPPFVITPIPAFPVTQPGGNNSDGLQNS